MFCVNRSHSSISVFQNPLRPGDLNPNPQIGVINHNDFFRWEWIDGQGGLPWSDCCVLIRNSSGVLQWGFTALEFAQLHVVNSAVVDFQLASPPPWNNLTLREFSIQNRSAELRRDNGMLLENLLVGTRIAVDRTTLGAGQMGQTWCAFWRVAAIFRPVLNQWQWADVERGVHAFVHTGLPENRPTTSSIRTSVM
jgi:hypothetical protein